MKIDQELISRKALLDMLSNNMVWGKNIPNYVWTWAVRIKENIVRVINELPAVNAESTKQEWISVHDRLPEINASDNTCKYTIPVLAFDGDYVMFGYFKFYIYDGYLEFCGIDEDDYEWRCVSVTHWMPLPEPPKGE